MSEDREPLYYTLAQLAAERSVHQNTVKNWLERMGITHFLAPGDHGVNVAVVMRSHGKKFIEQHASGIKPKRISFPGISL